jgi:hypothetical protein
MEISPSYLEAMTVWCINLYTAADSSSGMSYIFTNNNSQARMMESCTTNAHHPPAHTFNREGF